MDVYVIWGFLGSGKTTLINYLLSSCLVGRNVVILENESGKESVDGALLRSHDYNVVDMRAGCICCTLRLEMFDQLREIEERFHPDMVLIEPSGLASLEDLRRIPGLSISGWISMLDVTMYDRLMRLNPAFYQRQFYLSTVLFLTKTELMESEEVERIVSDLYRLHQGLLIVPDYRQCDAREWDEIWKRMRLVHPIFLPVQTKTSMLLYATRTIGASAPLDRSFFEREFLSLNRLFGNQIVRAKGLFRDKEHDCYRFDMVGGSFTWNHEPKITCERNGFLSAWWIESDNLSPDGWLSLFLNGQEMVCSVDDLKIANEEIYNYMGYKSSVPEAFILDFIRTLKEEALSICCPHVGFRFLTGEKMDHSHLRVGECLLKTAPRITVALRDADFYVMMLSTVGEELDAWITEKRNSGDVMVAYIADILGSVFAEAVVSYGQALLERLAREWDLCVSNAYSPGYCDWNVSEQQLFFSMLPVGFCGVTLTDSCMMLPIKSVSSLLAVGKNTEKKPYGCAICQNKSCIKRKDEM